MKKILVIEDEPEMRRNIVALLQYKEYQAIEAGDGRLGLEMARRERPDLILCDVMMPELDGYGVLRALQADATLASIPFIFLTAKGEKDDLRSGMNLGADDYLTKPAANDDLVQAIEARLQRSTQKARREFKPDFSSAKPLVTAGLTPRAAETLLWLAQGKTNSDIGTILGISESTVKKHVQEIFGKLGVETRGAATLRALELLSAGESSAPMKPNWARTRTLFAFLSLSAIMLAGHPQGIAGQGPSEPAGNSVIKIEEGFVDARGMLIYYKQFGNGPPLFVLHGGPGASHDYFLPHFLPLARRNRLVFIDERGSGRSAKLENPSLYTVENMVEDVEAVRASLRLEKINLLGHSCGGVLAQAYAFKYQTNLSHLILCSTFHSTKQLNEVFRSMKAKMAPELRERIEKLEQAGLFGHGKDYEKNRYPSAYMVAAWGEGYFPYLFQKRPDANFDPGGMGNMAWDVYREMWGSHGEFVVDGNLASVEYSDRLPSIKVPTLITVGDHDECDPSLAQAMHALIPGSRLVVLPESGHMTFVDQPGLFITAVEKFLSGEGEPAGAGASAN